MEQVHQSSNQNKSTSSAESKGGLASFSAPEYSNSKTGALEKQSTDVIGDAEKQYKTVKYELIAHGFAYSDELSPGQKELAGAMGFSDEGWSTVINDNSNTGFFAAGLLPKPYCDADMNFNLDNSINFPNPVLAFRGSEAGSQFVLDWINNDMDPIGVGYTAFQLNYKKVENNLSNLVQNSGKKVVVTGHSLGGALAKLAALHFPQFIESCYTYQAPGIPAQFEQYLKDNKNSGTNVNGEQVNRNIEDIYFESHSSEGDIVNYANGGRVPHANRIKHDPKGFLNGNTPMAHTLMLTSSKHYTEGQDIMKEKLGDSSMTTKDLYEMSKMIGDDGKPKEVTPMETDSKPEKRTDQTHKTVEFLRKNVIAGQMNPHSELILEFGKDRINQMPIESRIIILKSLLHKSSLEYVQNFLELEAGDKSIEAINIILEHSDKKKDLIKGAGAAAIYSRLGEDILGFLKSHYFSVLEEKEGAEEIKKHLDGGFLGVGDNDQEVIIANILINNNKSKGMLTNLGENYNDGLEIVLRKLQGKEDSDVSDKFKFTDNRRGFFSLW